MHNIIHSLPVSAWSPGVTTGADEVQSLLESGRIAYFPRLEFAVLPAEKSLFSGRLSDGRSKNINLRSSDQLLRGAACDERDYLLLYGLLSRYARFTRRLVQALLPVYAPYVTAGNTSFRPVEIEGRDTSWRKDDTRLHVDSFPSNPTGGSRLLRVFSNVNPHGAPRVWRLGEPFRDFAEKFRPHLHPPLPLWTHCLHALGITKSRRSAYDHLMLQLHDGVKADIEYQRHAPQMDFGFPAGSTWVAFTDQVLHAAMAGQFLLEQTFYLAPSAVRAAGNSPLRVLEDLCGRRLLN